MTKKWLALFPELMSLKRAQLQAGVEIFSQYRGAQLRWRVKEAALAPKSPHILRHKPQLAKWGHLTVSVIIGSGLVLYYDTLCSTLLPRRPLLLLHPLQIQQRDPIDYLPTMRTDI